MDKRSKPFFDSVHASWRERFESAGHLNGSMTMARLLRCFTQLTKGCSIMPQEKSRPEQMFRTFKKRLILVVIPNLLLSRTHLLLRGHTRHLTRILAQRVIILTLGVPVTQTISMNVIKSDSIKIKAKRRMTPRNQPRLALINSQSTCPRTRWTLQHPHVDLFSMMRT
jgi:hypothetical protein